MLGTAAANKIEVIIKNNDTDEEKRVSPDKVPAGWSVISGEATHSSHNGEGRSGIQSSSSSCSSSSSSSSSSSRDSQGLWG